MKGHFAKKDKDRHRLALSEKYDSIVKKEKEDKEGFCQVDGTSLTLPTVGTKMKERSL